MEPFNEGHRPSRRIALLIMWLVAYERRFLSVEYLSVRKWVWDGEGSSNVEHARCLPQDKDQKR